MTINGVAFDRFNGNPAPSFLTPGGYALTTDVDEDFWNEWLAAYKNLDVVRKNIIYAMPKPQDAKAKARELKEVVTGLEPLDPEKLGKGLEPMPGINRGNG